MTARLKSVLVGSSLGDASDPAVRTAAAIASRCGARLHVVHAFPMPAAYLAAPRVLGPLYTGLLDVEQNSRRVRLATQLDRLGIEAGREADAAVVAGVPHRALADHARENAIDLIVVGASEEAGARGLGSVADRVLRQALAPVLVVRGTPRIPPLEVLAPVDLSESSTASLARGLAALDAIPGAAPAISLFHALSSDEAVAPREITTDELAAAVRAELQELTKTLDPDRRWRMTSRVEVGGPRRTILARLAEEPADLVIIGTHGHGGFVRLLIGSVAEAIARLAPTSVLLVPPSREDV